MKTIGAYVLGIDVGGTHVDIVAVNEKDEIIAFHKTRVLANLEDSIVCGVNNLCAAEKFVPQRCKNINLGTTLAMNSLLELKSLQLVGIIRIAGHYPELPPAFNWPKEKKQAIIAGCVTISGGREHNNKSIGALNYDDVYRALEQLLEAGAESIVVIGVFSPLYASEETLVAQLIAHSQYSDVPVTLSHQIGGLGFIERENNAIINAALKKTIKKHFVFLENKFKTAGFTCPVFITQNNGTVLSLQQAMDFPIRTIASGPTNSLIGACKLAELQQAIVIDIGGTSTDIGVVENGFPRYSSAGAMIAGIPTNFMLPNIQILSLGGGSIIHYENNCYVIGSESVGSKLFSDSQSFNGKTLTLFDVGNVLKQSFPLQGVMPKLLIDDAHEIMQQFMKKLEDVIRSIVIDSDVKILLVGGGAHNIPEHILQNNMLRPMHYQVANAYGAALAEVSATIDITHALDNNRQNVIATLELQAINEAIANGAAGDEVRIIEKRLLPFHYMEKQLTRIIIVAAGRKSLTRS